MSRHQRGASGSHQAQRRCEPTLTAEPLTSERGTMTGGQAVPAKVLPGPGPGQKPRGSGPEGLAWRASTNPLRGPVYPSRGDARGGTLHSGRWGHGSRDHSGLPITHGDHVP